MCKNHKANMNIIFFLNFFLNSIILNLKDKIFKIKLIIS